MRAELRNKDRDMEDLEERHQVEIKVYKQKVKHLLYEHQSNITTLKADGESSLMAQLDDFKKREQELLKDKRFLRCVPCGWWAGARSDARVQLETRGAGGPCAQTGPAPQRHGPREAHPRLGVQARSHDHGHARAVRPQGQGAAEGVPGQDAPFTRCVPLQLRVSRGAAGVLRLQGP